jgi:hypothetical protein
MRDRVDLIMDAWDYLKYRIKHENQAYLMREGK